MIIILEIGKRKKTFSVGSFEKMARASVRKLFLHHQVYTVVAGKIVSGGTHLINGQQLQMQVRVCMYGLAEPETIVAIVLFKRL